MKLLISEKYLCITGFIIVTFVSVGAGIAGYIFVHKARNRKRTRALNNEILLPKKSQPSVHIFASFFHALSKSRTANALKVHLNSLLETIHFVSKVNDTVYARIGSKFHVSRQVISDFEVGLPVVTSFCCGLCFGIAFQSVKPIFFGLLVGYLLGLFLCNRAIIFWGQQYRRQFEKEIPSMMSMTILAIQAGASFDTAFNAYGSRFSGSLAHEAQKTYALYISQVLTRNEALDQMAQKVDVDIFYRFVATVKRALYLGSPLALALEHQLTDVRTYRTEKIKEEIAKKPIQILLPLGLFILPAMLILLLGPVLMEVMQGISMG